MHFSFDFIFHFIINLAAFLLFGISLCCGSWRNVLRNPYGLGAALIVVGHILDAKGPIAIFGSVAIIVLGVGRSVLAWRNANYVPFEVREGHNLFSILVGVGLFGLAVQLHYAVFGVPVFELVK